MYQLERENYQRVICYIKNFCLDLVVFGFGFQIRKLTKNHNKHLLMDNRNKFERRRRPSGIYITTCYLTRSYVFQYQISVRWHYKDPLTQLLSKMFPQDFMLRKSLGALPYNEQI